jgi:hypothetical protein
MGGGINSILLIVLISLLTLFMDTTIEKLMSNYTQIRQSLKYLPSNIHLVDLGTKVSSNKFVIFDKKLRIYFLATGVNQNANTLNFIDIPNQEYMEGRSYVNRISSYNIVVEPKSWTPVIREALQSGSQKVSKEEELLR